MKEPSFRITTILSFVIHITFLFVAFIIVKQTNHFVMPASYIVRLVGPEIEEGAGATFESTAKEISEYPAHEDAEQYASDRIAAIKAKRKIKNIVRLRNIISLKGSSESYEAVTEVIPSSENAGKEDTEQNILNSYSARIGAEIHQYWVIPKIEFKGLEAKISITILKDGTVRLNNIEKSSGNLLFDRSVLKAISKASPVSPPPYEMEIGLRFTP